jgi:hypothetical protein
MVVVAGLFDSQSMATEAMDRLLRMNIEDLDTHVIEPGGNQGVGGPDVVIPLMPNTGALSDMGGPGGTGMAHGSGMAAGFSWLNDLDEVQRAFYQEGTREGATLALAKVRDEDAGRVRALFRELGARTYTED